MTTSHASDGWFQRWRRRRHTWKRHWHPCDNARYMVAPVDARAARLFVTEHHYAASWPATRLCYGLIDRTPHEEHRYPLPHPTALLKHGRLVGVAALSVPQHPAVLLNPFPDLVPCYESIDLGRFVLLDPVPGNAESWFLARAFRLAAADGIRAVVAYADPVPRQRGDGTQIMPGHIGWSYQGHNALYLGRSSPARITLLPVGTSLPARTVSKLHAAHPGAGGVTTRLRQLGAPPPTANEPTTTYLPRALDAIGAVTIHHPGKHKYAWQLDRSPAARLAQRVLPYPKAADLIPARLKEQ
ncbi:hypothetical protein [Polymorphospora sp. NPDC050346]|uniref:Mom family adenine methylcarbamoylation protein n=1 Tax=Polymorphospora sp. NPDC050346 TaxID=3155780 RepID=UPI0033FC2725